MKIIQGDLIKLAQKNKFDMIIHGCNCFCTMGAGIAKTIKEVYPEAYYRDLLTVKGDESKLGTITWAVKGEVIIVNAYTQYKYYGSEVLANYNAIQSCFELIADFPNIQNMRIGYPKIGAGLAGGDWNIIAKIINEEFEGLDHTLVEFV